MDINKTAVYATRSIAPYHENDFYYTQSKDGKTVNVFHINEASNYQAPHDLIFTLPENFKPKKLQILGIESKISWKKQGIKLRFNFLKNVIN
jgi:alpha-L-fucosidase